MKTAMDHANRREFLVSSASVAMSFLLPLGAESAPIEGVEDAAVERKLSVDPRRPQFHLLPAKNWMNDPNGPIYFGGKYHMFFQYDPNAAVWGDMSWYHSVSPDMLHWTHLPLALTPSAGGPDSFGCFSGSALRVRDRVYQIYTGTRLGPKNLVTIRDGEDKIQESQCLAWSDDPLLVKWTKLPEPIIPLPPAGMKITGFRDPSVWKQGEWYYMTVGSGESEVGGCVLLYRTKTVDVPGSWTYLHKLASGEWNGKKTANPCDDGEMWECPDFFSLDGGHVLIYSTLKKVFWQSGKLDAATMKFTAAKSGELDLGAFYAPKTQLDADGRRILWGWIPERRSDAEMVKAGWSGMMSLPRLLKLDADGTLSMEILPGTAALRRESIAPVSGSHGKAVTLKDASGEVLCSGTPGSELTFTIGTADQELMRCVYLPARHTVEIEGTEIKLGASDRPTFHAFVDGSVIELIVAGRIGSTRRFYYAGDRAPDVRAAVTGNGAAIKGWHVAPISPNRLTTPAKVV